MWIFFLSNTSYSNVLNSCPKTLLYSVNIKKNIEKALNSSDLSICKYYVITSNRLLYTFFLKNTESCECSNTKTNDIYMKLEKAEVATNLKNCKIHLLNALESLDVIVTRTINCKISN